MDANTILERAAKCDWPTMMLGGSIYLSGEEVWRRRLPGLPPGLIEQAAVQLNQHEGARARRLEIEARQAADDLAREEARRPLDFNDPNDLAGQEARAILEEAEERVRLRAQPATRGDMLDLIEIMRDIRDSLTGRRA